MSAARALEAEGLRAGAGPREWAGALEGGLEALAALGQRLAAAGVPLAEARLREPAPARGLLPCGRPGDRRVSGVVFRAMALAFWRDHAALAMSLVLPVAVFLVFVMAVHIGVSLYLGYGLQ